jgi:hypothetical protein
MVWGYREKGTGDCSESGDIVGDRSLFDFKNELKVTAFRRF